MLDTYNDIPDAYGEWAKIEEFTGNFTTDEEIWEIAKQSDDIPHFGNILLLYTFSNIEQWCDENGHECTFYINAVCSDLYINGERVKSMSDFIDAIALHDEQVA